MEIGGEVRGWGREAVKYEVKCGMKSGVGEGKESVMLVVKSGGWPGFFRAKGCRVQGSRREVGLSLVVVQKKWKPAWWATLRNRMRQNKTETPIVTVALQCIERERKQEGEGNK